MNNLGSTIFNSSYTQRNVVSLYIVVEKFKNHHIEFFFKMHSDTFILTK